MKIPNQSTWEEYKYSNAYPKVSEDLNAEVVIIGGGLTGIISAFLIAKAGRQVVLLEKEKALFSDTTMYTTAHITKVLDSDLSQLVSLYGKSQAKLAWEAGQTAVDTFEKIIEEEKIDCEFQRCSCFTYVNSAKDFKSIEEEHDTAVELGFESKISKSNQFQFKNFGSWEIPHQAKFHPIKFAQGLAEKLKDLSVQIYTHSEVTDIKDKNGLVVFVNDKAIHAQKVIVATYKPIKLLKTFAKKGMYKSYVYEVEIKKDLIPDGLYQDTENPYHYFRMDNDESKGRMILGGEDHRMELKIKEAKNFKALSEYLKSIMGNNDYKIVRQWAGPILEPSDGLALIGESKPGQFVATAFSGNGMTYAMIAGLMFRDLIAEKKNPWTKLFDPTRIPNLKQLARKGLDYTEEFFGGAAKNIFKKA